jgi:hypothetical protein
MSAEYFHRHGLAANFAQRILSAEVGSAATSGLFLAAPRRTGKSTFLREDLRPALLAAGAFVLYVDLWADRTADPGKVIVGAVRSALSQFDGVITKIAKRSGLSSVAAGGVTFSIDNVGIGTAVSLSDALTTLSDDLKMPIVLIIDEAQQAIVSDSGYDALYALKAARDELNSTAHYGLRIVATGSNSDKLAMLRNSKDQAFFNAPLISFPPLDMDYVRWFCDRANLVGPLDPEVVSAAFARASFRPEILGASVDQLRFDFALTVENLHGKFVAAVDERVAAFDQQTLQVVSALTPLQSAVLRVLAARGNTYAPFDASTMGAYTAVLTAIAPNEGIRPDVSNVQQVLMALQDKLLVWKEKRGVYALEEPTLAGLLEANGMLVAVPR